jgi:predicted site-specific integrase-resolvase
MRSPVPAGPALVTGPIAATEAGVATATIRKWVQLGHLTAAARQGKKHLYRLEDVFAAERTASRRADSRTAIT